MSRFCIVCLTECRISFASEQTVPAYWFAPQHPGLHLLLLFPFQDSPFFYFIHLSMLLNVTNSQLLASSIYAYDLQLANVNKGSILGNSQGTC